MLRDQGNRCFQNLTSTFSSVAPERLEIHPSELSGRQDRIHEQSLASSYFFSLVGMELDELLFLGIFKSRASGSILGTGISS